MPSGYFIQLSLAKIMYKWLLYYSNLIITKKKENKKKKKMKKKSKSSLYSQLAVIKHPGKRFWLLQVECRCLED